MLHGTSLRNVTSHVCSRSIDATATAALAMPGVVAVLTHDEPKNLPNRQYRWGLSSSDRRVAVGKSRDAGVPVAAVAAVEEAVATTLDVTLIDYRMPPRVTSSSEVMVEGAARLREEIEKLKDDYFRGEAPPVDGISIFQRGHYKSGDVEKVFESAARVVRNPYSYKTETK